MSTSEQPIQDTSEYIRGYRHCEQGLPHQDNQSPDYDRGYRCAYEEQEVFTAIARRKEMH